jgi:hypothetical protein
MDEYESGRTVGKRGRAVSELDDTQTAPTLSTCETMPISNDAEPHVHMPAETIEPISLYSVDHDKLTRTMHDEKEMPFKHSIQIHGPENDIIQIQALFDGGAMVAAMCTSIFNAIRHRLGKWNSSTKRLKMANGTVIPSEAVWHGVIELGGRRIHAEFEVFDSQGGWSFLFGKPLLRRFGALHDFETDTVSIHTDNNTTITLRNEAHTECTPELATNIGLTLETNKTNKSAIEESSEHEKHANHSCREVFIEHTNSEEVPAPDLLYDMTASEVFATLTDEEARNILTRSTDPYKPERVERILKEVTIGTDITAEQHQQVQTLIREYADCFALAIKEVNAIPGAVHKLNIAEGTKFSTKIPPRSYNPSQRRYMEEKVDEMLEAGIIRQIHPRDVRAVAPTVLAQKAHEGQGLSLDELKHKLNVQCIALGLLSLFEETSVAMDENTIAGPEREPPPTKWRMCQDFNNINKVTEIAPVPQGDIRAKQLRLSGHCYIHVFDFAAGFYGIAVDPESQPYIVFYVEGRGYFAYTRMPFGVTGGPVEFGHTTAQRFHDLIAQTIIELFVDDGGSAVDTFEEGLTKLRILLDRVRREKMSLSPSKLRVFMTHAIFAGAQVGPDGVTPDSTKLTAIVDWPIPQDASHLEGFLGLTSYFRDLIKGYATLEGPLRNLLKEVDIPAGTKKQAYQRIMKAHRLVDKWTEEHTKTFVLLKAKLISEPVLSAPRYDGTPFVLTTDGCVDAFAGVTSQKIKTTLPGGKEVTRLHPIAFASKRTSLAESRYKPFLLEFHQEKHLWPQVGPRYPRYPRVP